MTTTTTTMLALLDWEAIYGLMTEPDGRPLLENKSPLRQGLAEQHRVACPYGGSRARAGKPMNVDALKGIAREFESTLSCTREMRSAIVAEGETASIAELRTIASAFKAWPLLHAFRGGSPSAVPTNVAHAFKVHVGLLAAVNLLIQGVPEAAGGDMIVSGEVLGTFIESRSVLVGAQESCAAPPKLLARFLETVCHGDADAVGTEDPALPDDLAQFAEMFGAVEALATLLDIELAKAFAHGAAWPRSEETRAALAAARAGIMRRQRARVLEPLDDAAKLARALRPAARALDGMDCEDLFERVLRPGPEHGPDAYREYCAFEDAILDRLATLQRRWNEQWPEWASAPPGATDVTAMYGFDPRAPKWWGLIEPGSEAPA